MQYLYRVTGTLLLCALSAGSIAAQDAPTPESEAAVPETPATNAAALAKAAQNPISSMISLPIQHNLYLGVERYDVSKGKLFLRGIAGELLEDSQGPDGILRLRNQDLRKLYPGVENHKRTQQVINIQPVYPVTIGELNIVNRLIVALAMPGRWVVGGLLNIQRSIVGDSDRPSVNLLLFQPFINYNFPRGWYVNSSPIITASWQAYGDDRWTIPIGTGVGRIFKAGKQPLNAQVGAYYNIEKPERAPDWDIRFQLQFMFPT